MHQVLTTYENSLKTFHLSQRKALGHFDMPENHFHDRYELYYLLAGERYYFIKDRTYFIKKGDLVFINAYELHKTTDTGIPNHERILITFTGDFAANDANSLHTVLHSVFKNNSHILRLSTAGQNTVETLFAKMVGEINEQRTGYEICLQSLLMQLLVFAARYQEQDESTSFEHPSSIHQKVSEIVRFINENYHETISLTSLSKLFYISPYYLSRVFKETTGFMFVEYLNSIRIKEAQRLLRESDLRVLAIAEQVGFSNIAHFGRTFKKLTGHSPLDYRKSCRS